LRVARAIANAPDYAHQKGVVHRDVKPSNILVAKDGRVVLSDFGLALDMGRGSQGEAFGTPHYISPEQARRSSDAVPQSDLYSMGVILYEMLTGVVPFDDPSPTTVALQHLSTPVPRPASINPELNAATDAVLEKALAKNPEERYASGQGLVEALEDALLGGGSAPAQTGLPPLPVAVLEANGKAPAPASQRISIAERVASQVLPGAKAGPTRPGRPRVDWKRELLETLVILLVGVAIAAGWFWTHPQDWNRLRLSGAIPFLSTPTARPLLVVIAPPTLTPTAGGTPTKGGTPTAGGTPSPSPRPSATLPASATFTLSPPTVTPTRRPSASATRTPASTASVTPTAGTPSATATLTVTPTPTGTATVTPTPSETPTETPTATVVATLTPTYSRLFMLFYDYNSFYLLNASGSSLIDTHPLTFERLDLSGQPLNRFTGDEWARWNSRLEADYCNRIEIIGSGPYLRPAECGVRYGVTRTPARGTAYIFWTYTPDSREFRVLWYNEPVAVCQIAAGVCSFYLP
jgi:serine/threonine-protein kinase